MSVGRGTCIHGYTITCSFANVQVRRMFATFGHEVIALHRSRVGGLTLEELPEGDWRPLRWVGWRLELTGASQ
jgi:hypothetical protein